jgi:hypothetical protein
MKHILPIVTIVLLATAMHAHAKARHHAARHHAASSHKVIDRDSSAPKYRVADQHKPDAHLPH